jgi:hypothetical protein
MLKKVVRIGIFVVLVASFFAFPASAKSGSAISEPLEWQVDARFYNMEWDGDTSGDVYFSVMPDYDYWEMHDSTTTIGELRSVFEEIAGYPVLILALVNNNGGCGYETDFVISTSDGDPISNYSICSESNWNYSIFLVYKAPPKTEIPRLTLFGYVDSDDNSYVMWSLSGDRNINVKDKLGNNVTLVCTVHLVDYELRYECMDGYNWLGEEIVNDPKWISWANKFASRNGK